MAKKKLNIKVVLAIAVLAFIAYMAMNSGGITGKAVWTESTTGFFPASTELAEAWTIVGPQQMDVVAADLESAHSGYYSMSSETSADVAYITVYKFTSEDAANNFYQSTSGQSIVYLYEGTPTAISSGSTDVCTALQITAAIGDAAQSDCINGNVVYEVQVISTLGQSAAYLQEMNGVIDGKF